MKKIDPEKMFSSNFDSIFRFSIRRGETPKTRFSPKNATFSYYVRCSLESTEYATEEYFMENFFHVIGEVFYSCICLSQPSNPMLRDMAPELEFFR